MATYKYIDKSGKEGFIGGNTPEEAISASSTLRDPQSGVQLHIGEEAGKVSTSVKSYVPTQSGIVQDTSAINTKDANTSAKITEKVSLMTGTGTPNAGTTTGGNGAYPVSDTGNIQGNDGKVYKTTAPEGATYTLPPLPEGKKYVYDPAGRPMVQDSTGAITNDPTADQQYEANKSSDKQTKDYTALYDTYKVGLDATHSALVDRIKESAKSQKDAMEVLNERALGAKRVQGYRTGSTEYTPEIDTGILKAEEEEGIARLAEIDANMNLALAQAESAKTEKDFELAAKRLELVETLQKNKQETIQNIYKAYVDNAKMIADKTKALEVEERAMRDQSLQELPVQAPELVKQYDSLKTQEEKDLWVNLMVKKTGLDKNIILGSLEKARLDVRNKESIIDKRETPTEKAISMSQQSTQKKKDQDNDIAEAILRFQEQIKTKNWRGINPDEYEFYKKYIKDTYGADAVLQFDKAIKSAALEIDNGEMGTNDVL